MSSPERSPFVEDWKRGLRRVATLAIMSVVGLMADAWPSGAYAQTAPARGNEENKKGVAAETAPQAKGKPITTIIQEITDGLKTRSNIEINPLDLYDLINNAKNYFPDDSLNTSFVIRFLDYKKKGGFPDDETAFKRYIEEWARYYELVKRSQECDPDELRENILLNMPDSLRGADPTDPRFQKMYKKLLPAVREALLKFYREKLAETPRPNGLEPTKLRDREYDNQSKKNKTERPTKKSPTKRVPPKERTPKERK